MCLDGEKGPKRESASLTHSPRDGEIAEGLRLAPELQPGSAGPFPSEGGCDLCLALIEKRPYHKVNSDTRVLLGAPPIPRVGTAVAGL